MGNLLRTVAHYLPRKEAIFVTVDLSDFFIDYYVHSGSLDERVRPEHDEKLKQLFACFAAHLTIQPATTSHAWTLHLQSEHPFSLFVAGEVERGFIVGHVISENIRHTDVNTLHAQVIRHGESSTSSVQSESAEVCDVVEHFYLQSEQLPVRIFLPSDSDTALVLAAMPDFDATWFEAVDLLTVHQSLIRQTGPSGIAATEVGGDDGTDSEFKVMRRHEFAFRCDCSPEKLAPYFRTIGAAEIDELFGEDESLQITCPRCGRRFALTREDLELDS